MIGFERILAPLDGSERAEAALSWVRVLPARHIRLLQVCPNDGAQRVGATRYLEEVASRLCPPGAAIEIRVVSGEPAEGIVAEAADAELIVMGTQGDGDGGRLLYGSVADRVARHAPAPALLLRGGKVPVAAAPPRRVVVPLDGSPAAERALPLATNLARMLGTSVHLISVSDEPAAIAATIGNRPQDLPEVPKGATAGAYLERIIGDMSLGDLVASTEVRAGAPADELLATVQPGDLLVITTHGRGEARRWQIGRVAEKLLRHAGAPIVLVRADSL